MFLQKMCPRPAETMLFLLVWGGGGGWFISLCRMSSLPTESILASGHFDARRLNSYELFEGRGTGECSIYSWFVQEHDTIAYLLLLIHRLTCSLGLGAQVIFPFDKRCCVLYIRGHWRKWSRFTIVKRPDQGCMATGNVRRYTAWIRYISSCFAIKWWHGTSSSERYSTDKALWGNAIEADLTDNYNNFKVTVLY